MLDLAASEELKTEFFAPAVNQDMNLMKELIDASHIAFGVSDGGAHTKFLTAGRFPTEGDREVRPRVQWLTLEHLHWRLSLCRRLRGLQASRFPARGRPGRYRDPPSRRPERVGDIHSP